LDIYYNVLFHTFKFSTYTKNKGINYSESRKKRRRLDKDQAELGRLSWA
jgi:hypothetical protein